MGQDAGGSRVAIEPQCQGAPGWRPQVASYRISAVIPVPKGMA